MRNSLTSANATLRSSGLRRKKFSRNAGGSLFRLRPNANVAVFVHFDVNHIRTTADGTIFDVTLSRAGRQVDGHDDFFAAGIADVARLVVQCRSRYFVLAGGVCKYFGKSMASSATGAPAAGISWPAVQRMAFVKKRR